MSNDVVKHFQEILSRFEGRPVSEQEVREFLDGFESFLNQVAIEESFAPWIH